MHRIHSKGRAKEGQIIEVRKDSGILFEEKLFQNGVKRFTLIVVYKNKGLEYTETNLKKIISEEAKNDHNILIVGDSNARIGQDP